MELGKETAESFKNRGRGLIQEEALKDFDEMVDNNSESWRGIHYLESVLSYCQIMRDESLTLEERLRKAYDQFQDEDHSGRTAMMTLSAIRRFCLNGKRLADEIEDFKYDPNGSLSERRERERWMQPYRERMRKIHEEEMRHRLVHEYTLEDGSGNKCGTVPVYTKNSGMFLVEFPYRYTRGQCHELLWFIRIRFGLCYGIFNNVPMFSFDTYESFFRRYNNGLTMDDYAEFREAMRYDPKNGKEINFELADKILKERTWKHLGKK